MAFVLQLRLFTATSECIETFKFGRLISSEDVSDVSENLQTSPSGWITLKRIKFLRFPVFCFVLQLNALLWNVWETSSVHEAIEEAKFLKSETEVERSLVCHEILFAQSDCPVIHFCSSLFESGQSSWVQFATLLLQTLSAFVFGVGFPTVELPVE